MSFLFVVIGSIVVLVVVTRIAGKRDAARKAALAARQQEHLSPDDSA